MTLGAALGLDPDDRVVAVVGAGGKTTLVYALAREAWRAGRRVLVTTTTHMGALDEETTGPVLVEAGQDLRAGLADALDRHGRVTLLGRRVRPDKLEGVAPERVDVLRDLADLVLVEADGARSRSLKLPAEHEPVIPASTRRLVIVAALDALGHPLDGSRVHRLELVRSAAGVPDGEPLAEEAFARVLAHPAGYPSRVPAGARAVLFLNKAEVVESAVVDRLAARLVPPYDSVVAGSARLGRASRIRPS